MEPSKKNIVVTTGLSTSGFYGSKVKQDKKVVQDKSQGYYKARSVKKKKDGKMNKNVSHKIRKPKPSKPKGTIVSKIARIRAKPIKMPSRLAINRNDLKEGKKTKLHRLSTPGVSLLEDADSKKASPRKKKFFTTRSTEAAVVSLSKTIKLSSVNGKIAIATRPRGLPKKNIGRKIEKELDDKISSGALNRSKTENMEIAPRASGNENDSPIATDVSSPGKANLNRATLTIVSNKIGDLAIAPMSPKQTKSLVTKARRMSPRKWLHKNSPCKENIPVCSPKRRTSPRKLTYAGRNLISPRKTSANYVVYEELSKPSVDTLNADWTDDDSVELEYLDDDKTEDAILSELLADENPAGKSVNTDVRPVRSPRRSPRKEMKNVKYFPIFDPLKRKIENKQKCGKTGTAKRLLASSDPNQMTIDAGQSVYGAIQCKSCGLLYEVGDPGDEELHNEFHHGLKKALAFNGWKNERHVTNVDKHGGRVLKIVPKDPSHWWRKVEEIIEIVDMDLGFVECGTIVKERSTAFLYVRNKSVSGCLIVEEIDKAFKFIQQVTGLSEGALLCCSSVPQKAFVGVSRVWVTATERRSGIASVLIDAMRTNMYPCHYLTIGEFAFSDPTESGIQFAKKYTQTNDFLVYRRSETFVKNNLT